MIATDKRKAIFLLHQEGMSAREIARRLGVDRDTVRQIIKQEGATPHPVRADKSRF
jgi:DNA-directed RNA polymerase specialized sigma24 family protein